MSDFTGFFSGVRFRCAWFVAAGFSLLCFACGASDEEASKPAIDLDALDESIDPCTDFYRFACGGWQEAHPLSSNASYRRRGDDAYYDMVKNLRPIVLNDTTGVSSADDPDAAAIGAHYSSCLRPPEADRAKVRDQITRIYATTTVNELLLETARLRSWGSLSFVLIGVDVDLADATRQVVFVAPRGWELPDRDDYLAPERANIRASYLTHVSALSALFTGVNVDGAKALEIETALVQAAPSDDERADPRQVQPTSIDDLITLAPHVPWQAMLTELGLDDSKPIEVTAPAYLASLDNLLASTSLATLQHYVAWQLMQDTASYLDEGVQRTDFSFWGPTYWGVSEPPARDWTCYTRTTSELGMELSHPYIARFFEQADRKGAARLVTSIRAALRHRLETASFLDATTRAEALTKLDAIVEKIAYPEEWPPSRGLALSATSYLDTHRALRTWALQEEARNYHKPVNRDEWLTPPITVNAFFRYSGNEAVLPAGILQPPYFDGARVELGNLGALGSVVGHEFTHGFDASGRLFDAAGVLRDWWTETTATTFDERAQCLVDQYSRFELLPGETVNGETTLAENIADAGGVILAHDVALARAAGTPPQAGYDAEQQFLIAHAQLSCENRRPESALTLLQTDTHAPNPARVNATLANMPFFAEAFHCAANAPMVNPTACSVW